MYEHEQMLVFLLLILLALPGLAGSHQHWFAYQHNDYLPAQRHSVHNSRSVGFKCECNSQNLVTFNAAFRVMGHERTSPNCDPDFCSFACASS